MLDTMKERLEQILPEALCEKSVEGVANVLLERGVVMPVLCAQCQSWERHSIDREFGTCYCRGFRNGVVTRENGFCNRGQER